MDDYETHPKKKKCCTPFLKVGVLVTFGVLFICLGAASIPFLEDFFKNKVKSVSIYYALFPCYFYPFN